ncbi:MAG: NAD-dependent protein deacylase [Lachnospiraceae bacterium]
MNDVEKLQNMIDDSHRIVFFGGAGVSTESGIPDFRSSTGLYHRQHTYPAEQVVSHSFFMQNPEAFYEFYKANMIFPDAKPNEAHKKLAQLEARGQLQAVITQNIDGLHQMAGSHHVLELHGSIHRNYCMSCKKSYDAAYVKQAVGVPLCVCGGRIKPDVVLYEEALDEETIGRTIEALQTADMLLIGGTSLVVYPAAGFIDYFRGKYLAVLNKDRIQKSVNADLYIEGLIGETLGRIR